MSLTSFFVTCPKGIETLLYRELDGLNLSEVRETVAGVSFKGSFEDALKVCLWSRLASRVLMQLSEFDAPSDTELYMGAAGIAWENYFTPDETIAVDFSGVNEAIRNTQYGALRVKDAVCDRLQKVCSSRPDVDRDNPDVRIYCHLERGGTAYISLDLSGRALLRREISRTTGSAPLKENLAAAMLMRAGYDGGFLYDPMCGSGTLLIEAAAMATSTAPGLRRHSYGFFKLKQFDEALWQKLRDEATAKSERGIALFKERGIRIAGSDSDPLMVEDARENAKRAGFEGLIEVNEADATQMRNPFERGQRALVITNPPYGKRLGNENDLIALYSALGEGLKREFSGSRAAVISSSADLLSCLKLHADRVYKLYNGEIPCQLRVFEIKERAADDTVLEKNPGRIEDFKNRLSKNFTRLKKWAARIDTDAFRIYDADVPEFAAAVDYYAGHCVIQTYLKKDLNPKVQKARELDMTAGVIEVTGIPGRDVVLKSREIQRGSSQYEKAPEESGEFFEVHEGDTRFLVNVRDYLDTGLFLDARLIRELIKKKAAGKRFLNLFCYTATASVAAASGGALSTTSVDMSRTYLQWGRRNLDLNGFDARENTLIQADVLSYLSTEQSEKFDFIYMDPPTFSNSKRMRQSFDVRRDHARLLGNLTNLLEDGGSVIFCTNSRSFKIDEESLKGFGYEVLDISSDTLPEDFKRDSKIHSCFELSFKKENRTSNPEPFVSGPAPRWQKEIGSGHSYAERRNNQDFGYDGSARRSRYDSDQDGRSYAAGGYHKGRPSGYGKSHSYKDGEDSQNRGFYGRDDHSCNRQADHRDNYAYRDRSNDSYRNAPYENEGAADDGKLHLKKRRYERGSSYHNEKSSFRDEGNHSRGYRTGDYGERREGRSDLRRSRRGARRDDRFLSSRSSKDREVPAGRVFGPDGVKDL